MDFVATGLGASSFLVDFCLDRFFGLVGVVFSDLLVSGHPRRRQLGWRVCQQEESFSMLPTVVWHPLRPLAARFLIPFSACRSTPMADALLTVALAGRFSLLFPRFIIFLCLFPFYCLPEVFRYNSSRWQQSLLLFWG